MPQVRRWIAAIAGTAGLLVGLIAAGPAAALAPGVFVDPNSPAGKEYSYPLSVLRAQGAGHSAARPGAGAEPLFGVGVTAGPAGPAGTAGTAGTARTLSRQAGSSGVTQPRRSSAPGGRARQRGGTVRRAALGRSRHRASGLGASTPLSPKSEAALARIASPSSSLPAIALIAVLVLVVGLALGASLARLGRRS